MLNVCKIFEVANPALVADIKNYTDIGPFVEITEVSLQEYKAVSVNAAEVVVYPDWLQTMRKSVKKSDPPQLGIKIESNE